MNNLVTEKDCLTFDEEGYVVLRNVLPEPVIQLALKIMDRWVEETIEGWKTDGLLEDTMPDMPFQDRFPKLWRQAGCPPSRRSPGRTLIHEDMYHLMTADVLLEIASALLKTNEIKLYGIFNQRVSMRDDARNSFSWRFSRCALP